MKLQLKLYVKLFGALILLLFYIIMHLHAVFILARCRCKNVMLPWNEYIKYLTCRFFFHILIFNEWCRKVEYVGVVVLFFLHISYVAFMLKDMENFLNIITQEKFLYVRIQNTKENEITQVVGGKLYVDGLFILI